MSAKLHRILFVCIGNSCRSQMAEGFARAYGQDVIVPASAGLSPALSVARDTIRAMDEKNINLRQHFPKSLKLLSGIPFDLIVNMSGYDLPLDGSVPIRNWDVADPIGRRFEQHCEIRDRIENLVVELILEFRRAHAKFQSA